MYSRLSRTRGVCPLLVVCVPVLVAQVAPRETSRDNQKDARDDALEGYSPGAIETLRKTFETLRELKSYSDDGVIQMKTDGTMMGVNQDQRYKFSWAKPRRFRLDTPTHELVSDGKELTTYVRQMQRYRVEPLKDDPTGQIEESFAAMGMKFGMAHLLLTPRPATYFVRAFKELDHKGEEKIDKDVCVVLEGRLAGREIPMVNDDVPAKIFLRKSDGLPRRIEIDMTDAMKKQFEGNAGAGIVQFNEFKMVYDIRDIRIDEKPDDDAFVFKAPAGARKVDRFYGSIMNQGHTLQQFELSGLEAPDFTLKTSRGEELSMRALRGHDVVLYFAMPNFGARAMDSGIDKLDDIQRDYVDKGVYVIFIQPSLKTDGVIESLGREPSLIIALDPDRGVAQDYFEEQWAMGVVLVNKEGIVQGWHAGFVNETVAANLRKDLDRLLAGETLPSAEKMTPEQLDEAFEQRAGIGVASTAEPLNEELLRESWSVRASGGTVGFSSGGSKYDDKVFWVRDKTAILGISPSGEKLIELPVGKAGSNIFGQDAFAVGKFGNDWVAVCMTTSTAGEEESTSAQGFAMPNTATLTATDARGQQLWKIDLQVKAYQVPQHLALANIDGKAGDEVVFFHDGAVCVMDSRGEFKLRKPCPGWATWLIAADRDGDGRAEIYVRSQYKLTRYDYAR